MELTLDSLGHVALGIPSGLDGDGRWKGSELELDPLNRGEGGQGRGWMGRGTQRHHQRLVLFQHARS